MQVLLAMHSRYAIEIFNGIKKYEYRKRPFRQTKIDKVIVYATEPTAMIVGEFTIDEILCDTPANLWLKTGSASGISKKKFMEYFDNRVKGYAIKIKAYHKYHKPLPIKDIHRDHPPQSFYYLEDDPL